MMLHMEHLDRRHAIAAELRAEIGRQNISRSALADAAGITVPTLRNRLEGKKPFVVDELLALLALLGINLPAFLDRVEQNA